MELASLHWEVRLHTSDPVMVGALCSRMPILDSLSLLFGIQIKSDF